MDTKYVHFQKTNLPRFSIFTHVKVTNAFKNIQKSTKNRDLRTSIIQRPVTFRLYFDPIVTNLWMLIRKLVRSIKTTKMNTFWTDSPPGSGQNRVQKLRNLWKSVKIAENHRWVPYKNHRKIVFRARLGGTFQNTMIFTPGSLLVTYR